MQYYEKSSGNQDSSQTTGQDAEDEDNDDIEAQIRKEVEGLKPRSTKPRLFQKVTSNLPCSKLPFAVLSRETLLIIGSCSLPDR